MSNENHVWSNSMYYIEVAAPYKEGDSEEIYALVNISTGVREGEYSFLPQAAQYAMDLTTAMESILEDGNKPQEEGNTPQLAVVEPTIIQ